MAAHSLNPRAILRYEVFVTPDLTAPGAAAFRTLAPPSGFADAASGPHFFKVRCLFCGEETQEDVAAYALAAGAQGCTDRFGLRQLTTRCHPTCVNPAHLVRKCGEPDCRKLGSIEVLEVDDGPLNLLKGCTRFLAIKSLGYQIVSYQAGQMWEATSVTGEVFSVAYNNNGFQGSDSTGADFTIGAVFEVEMT